MSGLLPIGLYGLQVPPGDVAIDANFEYPATIRITMAAIDTSKEYEPEDGDDPKLDSKRCVLKLIRISTGLGDEDSDFDSDEDEEDPLGILNGDMSDSEDDSEGEEANGGPSDPEKSKKARKDAAVKVLKEALADTEDIMDVDNAVGGKKGKGILTIADSDEDDEDDEDDDYQSPVEEFVLCTLDPDNHYQQPLDITIGEKEHVLFRVTGNYSIHLCGNYVVPIGGRLPYDDEEEDEEYDLSPDEDELDLDELDDSEEDLLDDLADPRITEVDSDEEAPKLVDTIMKGKNKRRAESDDEEKIGLDEIIGKSLKPDAQANGEPKLSKKQLKKLKNNAGQPVTAESGEKATNGSPASKKVQFAKNLEQGPSGSTKKNESKATDAASIKKNESKITDATGPKKAENKVGDTDKPAAIRKVEGVTIDDRKSGKGPAAKKGSRVSMRYIGKLQDGKVFDSNKSGKPFSFKLGTGAVIKGWDLGIEGIQVGGERRITVPADKGYGKKSQPGIPANSTLIFDVKCIEIK